MTGYVLCTAGACPRRTVRGTEPVLPIFHTVVIGADCYYHSHN